MKRHILFFAFCMVLVAYPCDEVDAQSKSREEQIVLFKQQLPAASDEEKIDLYGKIAAYLLYINADSAIHYAAKSLELAQMKGDDIQKTKALQNLGKIHDYKGELLIAQDYFIKGLELAKKLEDPELKAHLNNSVGIVFARKGHYSEALGYFLGALEVWQQLNSTKRTAILLANIGLLYKDIKDYEHALETTLEALNLSREMDKQSLEASCLHNLAEIYFEKGAYKDALNTFQKALAIKTELGYTVRKVSTYIGIGKVYAKMNMEFGARDYYGKAIEIAEANNHHIYLQKIYFALGELEKNRGNDSLAIAEFQKSLEIAKAYEINQAILECLDELAAIYIRRGDFKHAYSLQSQHRQLSDSLYSQQYKDILAEYDAKFELTQKEQKIAQLKLQQESDRIQKRMLLMIIICAFTALCITFLLFRNKRRANRLLSMQNAEIAKKNLLLAKSQREIEPKNNLLMQQRAEIREQNLQLKQSNDDLRQFAYVASHDLREPLRTIRSYMQLVERRYREHLDEEAKEFIDYATDGAMRMDELLQDLLAYSRIGREHFPKSMVDMNQVLDKVRDALQHQIKVNQAQLIYGPMPYIEGYESQLYLLFQNLVSNAIKFRKEDEPPVIKIDAMQENESYLFSVKDNGIGIDEKYRERVFTIFQRLHSRTQYEGTGIGLAICKKIVLNHEGDIWLDSEEGVGTTFYIRLHAKRVYP